MTIAVANRDRAHARARRRQGLPPTVALTGLFLLAMLLVTLFAQLIQPHAFEEINLLNRMKPPFPLEGHAAEHLLGTDRLGRDLFSRLLVATQTSIVLALLGTIISAVLGAALGLVSAHFGGLADEAIMALVDFQAAMPYFIIALAVLAFLGNSMVVFLPLMGIYGWEKYARITRGLVLSAREQGYARAVHALGGSAGRIHARHVLPNIRGPLIVQVTINFPETILFETSLSFIGLGIRPPLTSLGQLLGDGRDYRISAWWLAVIPGMVILVTTLSMSIVGDHVRARLDPSLQD